MTVSLCRTRNLRALYSASVGQSGVGRPPRAYAPRSGRIATHQKAVQRRGPGRVVLGSKPQLATPKKLVSWAERADCQKLVSWAGEQPQLATPKSSSFNG